MTTGTFFKLNQFLHSNTTNMKKAKPITTDLFRFATLRTPQLLSSESKKRGFIYHEAPNKSFFLKEISNYKNLDKARKKLDEIVSNFTPIQSPVGIKNLDKEVYEFSIWLIKNRNTLTPESMGENRKGLDPLAPEKLIFAWDNLFYQIITKESVYVRQACIQLILANNFLHKTATQQKILKAASTINKPRLPESPKAEEKIILFLRRLANAKVVIPMAFTTQKNLEDKYDVDRPDFSKIEKSHEVLLSDFKANTLLSTKSQLLDHNKQYVKSYNAAWESARIDHDKKVAKANADYIKNLPPNNPKDDKELPELKNPVFNFKYAPPLSQEFVKDKLNPEIQDFITANKLESASVSSAIKMIDSEISTLKKMASTKLINPKNIVVLNGNIIKDETLDLHCFTVSFSHNESIKSLKDNIYLTINVGYQKAFFVSANYTLQFSGLDETFKGSDTEIINNNTNNLLVKLFPKKTIKTNKRMLFTLDASLGLNDGTNLKLSVKGLVQNPSASGCAIVKTEIPEHGENPIYGVNRLGIADYRRVEQEVCCYKPGEVSHIENILAREYKERHTRNLTSTETTFEETSEVEIENQTDTASTQRNELQSEVAKVLGEENSRSYGASTGSSGKFMGAEIKADAYADFASSNSSSDSNSTAKTYAEEVVHNALERVVQKTSEKRTSKILKEYEENNRHGFDNREGNEHVTGVYRWVDKIYVNRLINYGKRLMFEFMIPEPARFFKKAIIKQVEEADSVITLEEPIHPASLDDPIKNASDIDEYNYQTLASIYDTQIDAPKNKETTAVGAYSLSPDQKEFSQAYNDIYIPEGYESEEATGTVTFDWKAKPPINDGGARINITVAGDQFNKTGLEGGRDTFTKNNLVFDFDGKLAQTVPVSISGNKIYTLNVSISALCKLKDEVFEQWQNEAYDALIRAYEEKLAAFNEAQDEAIGDSNNPDKVKVNPRFNRTTEMREMQRVCIEMLTKPFDINMGKNFYNTIVCNNGTKIPQVRQNKNLEDYASHVKFFEQAFDWEIMSYIFYPYYWAHKCKWVELFQSQDSSDPLFKAFLQSGMARVIVPVRLGFEDAVTYYTETGDIWNGGGLVIDTDNDLYLSIAEEMQEVDGVVEEEWTTTVPSTLTVVQNESVLLDEGGLPCCDSVDNEDATTNLLASSNIIGLPENVEDEEA